MCQVYTCKYISIAIPKTTHFVDKKRKSYSMKNKERQRKWMTAESWKDLVDRINRKESLLDFRQVKTMTFNRRLCKKESPRDPFPYDFNKLHAKQRVEFKGEGDSRCRRVKKSKKRDRKFLSGREFWLCSPSSTVLPPLRFTQALTDWLTYNPTIMSKSMAPFTKAISLYNVNVLEPLS